MEYGVSYYCLKPVTYPEIKQKLANIRQMLEQEKYKGQPEKPKGGSFYQTEADSKD